MVGEEYMVDYLLYYLNQTKHFNYVSYMKLDEPMDDARLMLAKTAVYQGMVKQKRNLETGEMKLIFEPYKILQRGASGRRVGWVDFDLLRSTILPSCSANFPRQNQTEGGTAKIKVNKVRQEMGHPVAF